MIKAILAFVALPGTVGFLIPLWLVQPGARFRTFSGVGWLLLAIGVTLLLWCVREFYVTGKGTLAPWSPPRHLVAVGLYRFSRNPMYVAVILVLWAWAAGFRSAPLAAYAAVVMVGFHLRVVFGEEPWLARTHGDQWTRYRARVRRWL